MSAQHDVVIIGGGAIGLWAAYYLKTRSSACRVAVVERDFAWTLASTPQRHAPPAACAACSRAPRPSGGAGHPLSRVQFQILTSGYETSSQRLSPSCILPRMTGEDLGASIASTTR
jgi:glycine/D-amino acid oxidase-like deaminating enzyme